MSGDVPQAVVSDPLAALKTPSGYLRCSALVVAVLAMVLPAFHTSTFGMSVGVVLPRTDSWALLFPVAVGLALVAPAVPALTPYSRLLDLVATGLGCIVSLYLLYTVVSAQSQLGNLSQASGVDFSRIAGGLSLGPGAYLVILATMISFVQVVRGRTNSR